MSAKKICLALLCLFALTLVPASSASGATAVWKLVGVHLPTNFIPGKTGRLFLIADNIGGAPAKGPITLTDTLPVGLKPTEVQEFVNDPGSPAPDCDIVAVQTVTCTAPGPIGPGFQLEVKIVVDVEASLALGALPDDATISSPGALPKTADTTALIADKPASFGFLAPREGGFDSSITDEDGFAVTAAGSHPFQLTSSLGFPSEEPEGFLIGAGHPRDVFVDFPRGLIINPTATSELCTEAELVTITSPGCPAASAVGTITATTFEASQPKAATSPLYNMVPPPGHAAMLAFDAAGIGVFIHLSGGVRSDGDYGITGGTRDVLALTGNPVFGARVELWGDPTSPVHDFVRGPCVFGVSEKETGKALPCPVSPLKTALLTLPGDCPGEAVRTRFRANSWERPDEFIQGEYLNADLGATPVPFGGCNELEYTPTVLVGPTTNLTDSPAGAEFDLHQPQDLNLGARAPPSLKDLSLTLPEGLVVNPSAGQGQEACTATQIGLLTAVGQTPIHFSKAPASCPDAAKLGSVQATSPLLAELSEAQAKVLRDSEGNPIPRPLKGSLYLAEPFKNPFGSLLALYIDIEDARSGIVTKFAVKASADPLTGQLTTSLTEGPELPIEDVRVRLFEGPRASLRTPPACGTYTATANLVPWSAPDTPVVQEKDSFALSAAPDGGPCPASASAAPHKPSFLAGTVSAQAGAFSPFVLKVSRADGTQPIGGFEATLPKGLSAKLAGVPYCPEAQIAQAMARNRPNEGAIEQASPSCPAASEIGTAIAAAGAGPTPLHTSGRVYLAGPYKGAPLSTVIITPAIAGPFDLGTVVVRAAAYLNPETAIVRVLSDPLPTILEGIPLDLRSAYVKLDRPQFTLNPTSCDPKEILATATSVFAQPAALSSRFQVGGCRDLGFKPKFSFRLKGPTKRTGHPELIVSGRFRSGDANLERASIAFPRSEFLDQAHIGTVCTRVQFAADQCPPRSVYGFAKARTPLLDAPLEGPVYLRSSSHELPDVVLALSGQVDVVLGSRVDSVNGGIRVTAEGVPDAPVTSFQIKMRGARKGLLINSVNLCLKQSYATVKLTGQSGKTHNFKAPMQNDCKKKGKKRRNK